MKVTRQCSLPLRCIRPRVIITQETILKISLLIAKRQRVLSAGQLLNDLPAPGEILLRTETTVVDFIRLVLIQEHHQLGTLLTTVSFKLVWIWQDNATGGQHTWLFFTCQFRFCLGCSHGRWQLERSLLAVMSENMTDKERWGWGGGQFNGLGRYLDSEHTHTCVFKMATDVQRCLYEVIRLLVILQKRHSGAQMVMHDSAPCHRSNIVSRKQKVDSIMQQVFYAVRVWVTLTLQTVRFESERDSLSLSGIVWVWLG